MCHAAVPATCLPTLLPGPKLPILSRGECSCNSSELIPESELCACDLCAGAMAPYDPEGTGGYLDEMLPADCLSIQEIGTAGIFCTVLEIVAAVSVFSRGRRIEWLPYP